MGQVRDTVLLAVLIYRVGRNAHAAVALAAGYVRNGISSARLRPTDFADD